MVFSLNYMKVYKDVKIIGMPILEGEENKFVYVILAETTYVEKTKKHKTTDLWHARMGHVS